MPYDYVLCKQLTNTTTEQPVVSEIKMRKRPILMIPLLAITSPVDSPRPLEQLDKILSCIFQKMTLEFKRHLVVVNVVKVFIMKFG